MLLYPVLQWLLVLQGCCCCRCTWSVCCCTRCYIGCWCYRAAAAAAVPGLSGAGRCAAAAAGGGSWPVHQPWGLVRLEHCSTLQRLVLVMSIGNKKFGIPRKYQYQIGIWYFCSKFLGIFWVFYRYFEKVFVKIWLNSGIYWQNKNRFRIGFCSCHFVGIGLVSV